MTAQNKILSHHDSSLSHMIITTKIEEIQWADGAIIIGHGHTPATTTTNEPTTTMTMTTTIKASGNGRDVILCLGRDC